MAVLTRSPVKLTYDDYLLLPDDNNIHEIIDGEHYVSASPSTYHQTVSRRLQFLLYEAIELTGAGVVFDAPTDVQFSDHDVVVPDIFVIRAERTQMISPSRVLGPPDLVIEIISPSSAKKDREIKRKLYERFLVPEYWLVNPEGHAIERFPLVRDRYGESEPHAESIRYRAGTIDVTVDLRRVW